MRPAIPPSGSQTAGRVHILIGCIAFVLAILYLMRNEYVIAAGMALFTVAQYAAWRKYKKRKDGR